MGLMNHHLIFAASFFLLAATLPAAEDRKARVLNDRAAVQAAGKWIYNDLPQGYAEAGRTGKPLLVIFRCVP